MVSTLLSAASASISDFSKAQIQNYLNTAIAWSFMGTVNVSQILVSPQ